MAKKKTSKKKSTGKRSQSLNAAGKHLVIVESPAKAKTINRYLGPDFVVGASIGHVRDLPTKSPKGVKMPVPGVDLENDFKPTYEVLAAKKQVVNELKKAAKEAKDVWFATDLDREGEAIAWHLANVLDIPPDKAKRVVFNAITRREIERAFENPHQINQAQVDAQQARRILDRIVGFQVSPLLWKKVARGLSAGRVQSVATKLVVEREREIRSFVPDESWKVSVNLSVNPDEATGLIDKWCEFITQVDERDKTPTIKAQNAWLSQHNAIKAELVEVNGGKFALGCPADQVRDLTDDITRVVEAVGLTHIKVSATDDPKGKGPAKIRREVSGSIDPVARYQVKSIETRRTTSKPSAPFITSTLQMAASSELSYGAQRTMRTAQGLYEGINIPGEGLVGLITYMRTDSTHIAGEALQQSRDYIASHFGDKYLPQKAKIYSSSNKSAQEAHEAIRPTDVSRHPDSVKSALREDQAKLYRLIWNRFVASQMTPAQWDSTSMLLERSDTPSGAVLKTNGRVLVFDGFFRVSGVPTNSDEQTLAQFEENQTLAPFNIKPAQVFTSPPPRYSEASLVKTLESEGIGRPSTYATIIQVIQDRNYVEQIDRRFFSTDLGEVVTDKLIEGFPHIMDTGYTRQMETELDRIAENEINYVAMLHEFYKSFSSDLSIAHETMSHAKAETLPALYECPKCASQTVYRFGKNGRFLSCASYPDCRYAAPIDREGQPLLPERVNVACPEDGSPMVLRTGRFGKFLASVNYPDTKYVVNIDKKSQIKYPSPPPLKTDLPCVKCEAPLNLRRGKRGPWLGCSTFPKCKGRSSWSKLDKAVQKKWQEKLEAHEANLPKVAIYDLSGNIIPNETPIELLCIPGGVQELKIHPEAEPSHTEAA